MNLITDKHSAHRWLREQLGVSRETMAVLSLYADRVEAEATNQNLVSRSTMGDPFWTRHIADSAQLVPLVESDGARHWVDIGSGAGLPGIVAAIIARNMHFTLVEPRTRRAAFLTSLVDDLGLIGRVEVVQSRIEGVSFAADVISARAVAGLKELVTAARHLAGHQTIWLLPKGENGVNELSTIPVAWQKAFHVKRSVTHPNAYILTGQGKFAD